MGIALLGSVLEGWTLIILTFVRSSIGIWELWCLIPLNIYLFLIGIVHSTGFHNNVYTQVHNTRWPCFLLPPISSSLSWVPSVAILLLLSRHTYIHGFMCHSQFCKQEKDCLYEPDSLTLTYLHNIGSCVRKILLTPMYTCRSRGSDEPFYSWRHHTPLCYGQDWLHRKNSQC